MSAGLCKTFRELADQTWERIEAAYATGLFWSEESNTETILLSLRTRHPREIAIASFSKRREALIGADWEWWFVGPSGAYGMRVQAKRIKLPSEIFSHLHYTPKGHLLDQMTSLIDSAARDGLTPVYCFYLASKRIRPTSTWPSVVKPTPQPISGCLVGHAQSIRRVHGNDLISLAPHLMPWHLLVCECVMGSSGDLAKSAEAAINGVVNGSVTISPRGPFEDMPDTMTLEAERRRDVPSYVARLLEGALDEESVDTVLKEADALARGIKGVVVFKASG